MMGTPSRNAAPHQNAPSSRPPTVGPRITPAMSAVPQIPYAMLSCFGSLKRSRISASTFGMTVAPAMPSTARAPMRTDVDGANAAVTEAAMNNAAPASSTVRRPIRSPSVPMVTRNPAIMKP